MQRNLIVQTAFLGDTLLSIPLIHQIRKMYPQAELWFLCREGLGEFLKALGLVDEAVEVKKNDRRSYKLAISRLRTVEFENIFSPHESFRTARTISKLNAQRTFGFKNWWNGWAFTNRIVRPMDLPEALRQVALLQTISHEVHTYLSRPNNISVFQSKNGVKTPAIPDWLSMKQDFKEQLPAHFKNTPSKKVVLAPGSQWNTKRWSSEGFSALGQSLKGAGFDVIVVGSESEKDICDLVAREIPQSQNLCGKTTLLELLSVLKKSAFLVTNDSGVMHMASVAGTPVVAVFGPTTLDLGYRPWQNEAIVVEKKLPCRPCGKHGHDKCPLGTHECMKSISPAEVFGATHSLARS